jgi:putative FmdB family regulatory protein
MPTYEYRCDKCGEHFDVFQTFAEDSLKKHPGKCGGKVRRVLSPAGIVFSGSGFYKTDNRSSSRSRAASSEAKSNSAESKSAESSSNGSKSSDSKSSDSKGSDSKSGSKSSESSSGTKSSGETKKSA